MRASSIKIEIEPLAIAVNATQADNARLDVVLIMLGYLYFVYADPTIYSDHVRHRIRQSLETRWAKCKDDRDIYILAVVLNPYIRCSAFRNDNPATTFQQLSSMLYKVYRRMLGRDPPLGLDTVFLEYVNELGEFSAEEMGLASAKAAAHQEVCRVSYFWHTSSRMDICAAQRRQLGEHLASTGL